MHHLEAMERRHADALLEMAQEFRADGDPRMFAGARLIGGARLRHRLNDKLRLDGGNIGYEIRPSRRGEGHGREILRLILLEARGIGLERALLTAAVDNAASRRVIEGQGGRPLRKLDLAQGRRGDGALLDPAPGWLHRSLGGHRWRLP